MTYKIWLERSLPTKYKPLLEGKAIIIGMATDNPARPLSTIDKAQAIIAGGRLTYNAALMAQVPNLRVITRTGIGVDNIDLVEATRRGIVICNAPDAPTLSTAEHTIALIFAVAKQLKWCDRSLQQGNCPDFFNDYAGFELYQQSLGLVGLGRIGRRVATLAQGVGMEVIAFDPFVSAQAAQKIKVELCPTLGHVLKTADIISLHLPLLPQTNCMINAESLKQMKRGAILINAARGGLVDESALLNALKTGHLRGAGLDVFQSEPPAADHPLLNREDVVVTPHIAAASAAGKDRLWQTALIQTLQTLEGERPPHLVNPEVWQTYSSKGVRQSLWDDNKIES